MEGKQTIGAPYQRDVLFEECGSVTVGMYVMGAVLTKSSMVSTSVPRVGLSKGAFKGTTQYKTASRADMVRLIDACFSLNHQQWKTGEEHPLPALKEVTALVENVVVAFGVLTASMGAVSRVKR